MIDSIFVERYGPSYMQVMHVLGNITTLDAQMAHNLIAIQHENADEHTTSALEVAQRFGIEAEAVRASEDCRREVWNVVWDGSTRADSWTLSWIAARAGMGAAVVHLVERGAYTLEDHMKLLGPWRAVFGEVEAS